MTRNRRSAKTAGQRMESAVESYLQWALQDERIMRLRLYGSRDVGDIGNVMLRGTPACIEVKNTTVMDIAGHLHEAEVEAGNMDSPFPIVVQKRRGIGIDTREGTGRQLVLMTLETFARICNDGLPLGEEEADR